MPLTELITQAEYARRRGCSKVAVRHAVLDGRIKLIDGKVDPAAADAQWQANSRPRAGSKPASPIRTATRPIRADRRSADGVTPDYQESRAIREAAEARRAETAAEKEEMELQELRGELIRKSVWEAAAEKKIASVRETVLQWPAQLAAVLAAESDITKCHDLLTDACMTLLAKISDSEVPA